MLNLVLPQIQCVVGTQSYGRFVISPLENGYGTTLGNALRRVLLASLEGAAVTSIRVSDVPHEFSTIPGVREDMMLLLLNVKQIRFKAYSDEPMRLRLSIQGEGVVTAGDLICPPELDVVNPEQYLFTVDDPDAMLDIEMTVEAGRGYSPSEDRGKLPIGELPVDAIYSPIRKVNYNVEAARVGQMTNYDNLTLEIWTDNTIRPEEALDQAAQLLIRHLSLFANVEAITVEEEPEVEEEEALVSGRVYETPIEELDLTVRVYNCLKRTGITKVGEVLEKMEKGPEEMLAIRNFGQRSLEELELRLKEKGFLDVVGEDAK
ncbi:MAG: DNA-directed RNA polymerase subunit alpha [Anaerolineae bacterium]|nr:DNA-directed RNA polymerase subunit alpha [Anaerolineae bacterium]